MDEALRRYEDKRTEIYKELEIAFVQARIRNKLLKKDDNEVELLFFDDDVIIDENVENLLSESAEESSEVLKEELPDVIVPGRKTLGRLYDFLDLEAQYSGEDEEECEDDGDLDGLIDNTVDNRIDLDHFAREKFERDERILQNLRRRFVKREKKRDEEFDFKTEILDSDAEAEFPEIREFEADISEIESENHPKNEGYAALPANLNKKSKLLDNDECLFYGGQEALEKIERKEDRKMAGFIEKNDK